MKQMKCRYIIFFSVGLVIQSFLFVFVTCFCGVFTRSQISWIQGGVISMVLRLFALQIVIPILQTANRFLAVWLKCRCLYELNFIVQLLGLLVN